MKNLIIILLLIMTVGIVSCKKDEPEPIRITDISAELERDVHFNKFDCQGQEFQKLFSSLEEYQMDDCRKYSDAVPISLDFNGIIAGQGVKVPYYGEGSSAYEKQVKIRVDNTRKKIYFDFLLTTIDTFGRSEKISESALVLLDGYDSTYQVIFNHEIIPLQE